MTSRTKKVNFSAQHIFSEDNNTYFLSDEEISSTWYSRQELKDILERCRLTVDGKLKHEPLRGLELVKPEYLQKHKEAVCTVLIEQNKQRDELGKVDPQLLARVAQQSSAHRQRMAQIRGIQDAQLLNDSTWGSSVPITPKLLASKSLTASEKAASRRARRMAAGNRPRQPRGGRALSA